MVGFGDAAGGVCDVDGASGDQLAVADGSDFDAGRIYLNV